MAEDVISCGFCGLIGTVDAGREYSGKGVLGKNRWHCTENIIDCHPIIQSVYLLNPSHLHKTPPFQKNVHFRFLQRRSNIPPTLSPTLSENHNPPSTTAPTSITIPLPTSRPPRLNPRRALTIATTRQPRPIPILRRQPAPFPARLALSPAVALGAAVVSTVPASAGN